MNGWWLIPAATRAELGESWDAPNQGRQLVSLAMFGDVAAPRYAALFREGRVRAWQIEDDIRSQAEADARSAFWAEQGYYPSMITATGSDDASSPGAYRAAVVYERGLGSLRQVVVPSAWSTFSKSVNLIIQRRLQRIPLAVDSVGVRDRFGFRSALYAAVTDQQSTAQILFSVRIRDDLHGGPLDASTMHQATLRGFARLEQAVPLAFKSGGSLPVLALYRTDTYDPWPDDLKVPFGGGVGVLGPMTIQELNAVIDEEWISKYWPLKLGANGKGSSLRYCVTFVRRGRTKPKTQYFRVVDAEDASPPSRVTITAQPLRRPPLNMPPSRWGPAPFAGAPRSLLDEQWRDGRMDDGWMPYKGSAPEPPGDTSLPSVPHLPQPLSTLDELLATIDAQMKSNMRAFGARSAQLVATVEGRLVMSRAYTLAELNYPVTQVRHLFALGSVSKWLVSMKIVEQFAPNGNLAELGATMPEVFGVTPAEFAAKLAANPVEATRLQATRLEDLLRHRSGWQGDRNSTSTNGVSVKKAQWGAAIDALSAHQRPNQPGDFTTFLKGFNGLSVMPALYRVAPNTDGAYNNVEMIALSEIVSRRASGGPAQYADSMRKWWKLGLGAARAQDATRELALDGGIVPFIKLQPDAAAQFVKSEAGAIVPKVSIEPIAYTGEFAFTVGAAAWCMSMSTLAFILAGMDPQAPVGHALSAAQVELLADRLDPAGTQALGVQVAQQPYQEGDWRFRRYTHNGIASGGIAMATFNLRIGGPGPRSVGLAVGYGVSAPDLKTNHLDSIQQLVHQILRSGYWDDTRNLFPLLVSSAS
jgi:hypothetical protein